MIPSVRSSHLYPFSFTIPDACPGKVGIIVAGVRFRARFRARDDVGYAGSVVRERSWAQGEYRSLERLGGWFSVMLEVHLP
jgi:hypothetical protein